MYIFKNALRSISRSKGRNILVGIIVLVIAISTCVALSIREAASKAKENTLDSIEITAQISVDRQSMMKNSTTSGGPPDMSAMREAFSGASNLTLNEMQTYAKADSVKAFNYSLTTSLNESDSIKAIDTTTTSTTSSSSSSSNSTTKNNQQNQPNMGNNGQGFGAGRMGTQGDFTVIGYSSDSAMTSFVKGTSTITEGAIFDEGTSDKVCVISDELALYNSLSVGSVITLVNPNNESETFELTIAGIYNNSQSTVTSGNTMGGFSASSDPANEIYMSYNALKAITDSSIANATTVKDTSGNTTSSTGLREQVSGTYSFANIESYNNFDSQARALGLADTYTISSNDVTSYEQSIQPLENLSKFATYFLIVVLLIGGIILIVLNIFNIRERKYEIGVLTAIGMKKRKVSLQFITELFVVTFACIIIGAGIGAAGSVPITNSLLKSQVSSAQEQAASQVSNFGRSNTNSSNSNNSNSNSNSNSKNNGNSTGDSSNMGVPGAFANTTTNYISEVSSATNFTVILQLIGIGILLTLVSSCAAVIFVLRYEPLKILTNRD